MLAVQTSFTHFLPQIHVRKSHSYVSSHPAVLYTASHLLLRTLHISCPSSATKSGNSIDSLPLQLPLPFHPLLSHRTYTQNHPRRLCKAAKLNSSTQMDYHYLGSFIRNTSQPQNTTCLQHVGHGTRIVIVLGINCFVEQREFG